MTRRAPTGSARLAATVVALLLLLPLLLDRCRPGTAHPPAPPAPTEARPAPTEARR